MPPYCVGQTRLRIVCRYRLTRLPKYMVLHMRRFTKNNFFVEKNPTIVNFPVKNLKLQDIVPVPTGASLPVIRHRTRSGRSTCE